MKNRYREKISHVEFEGRVVHTRMQPAAILIARDYLVVGCSLCETARRHRVAIERVRQIVARVAEAK